MKNFSFLRLIVLALLVGICAMPMDAASKKKKKKKTAKKTAVKYSKNTDLHFISMWGGGGYSGMVNNGLAPDTYNAGLQWTNGYAGGNTFESKFVGSGGGLVGFGYEMWHKRFLFSVGPEVRLINSSDKFSFTNANDAFPYDYFAKQTQYGNQGMVTCYDFDKLRQTQQNLQVTLPIMFGGNFDRYYFMAGVKVGYQVKGWWQNRGTLTTKCYDPMAVDHWAGVESHAYTTAKLAEHELLDLGSLKGDDYQYGFKKISGLDAALSLEFGLNLNEFFSDEWNERNEESKHPWRMRVGAFIDYGVPVLYEAGRGTKGEIASLTGETMHLTPMAHTSWAADQRFGSLLVGVKFTALLQLNKPKLPNPRMLFCLSEVGTDKRISAGKVAVQAEGKSKPQIKTMKKFAKPKAGKPDETGTLSVRYAKGNYKVAPNGNLPLGYLDAPFIYEGTRYNEPVIVEHEKDMVDAHDTVGFQLYARPMVHIYVHDATTEQLISARADFTVQGGDEKNAIKVPSVSDSKLIFVAAPDVEFEQTYTVHIVPNSSRDYHDTTAVMTIKAGKDTADFYLRPIKRIRRTLILKNMHFATDKTEILELSETDLQTLYSFLADNPRVRVLITGHTDSQGSDSYNQKLSEGRAASVKAEMVKRGIAEDRMETDGKGESEPIDTNDTEEGRQNNRRVQITVLNAEDAEVDVY